MNVAFDAGPVSEPFASFCRDYPREETYPRADFRVEWGPIFYRGRLDGSAVVLVIGQDPAAHEVVARRILFGVAGHRVQGLLAKLGITKRYVMINTFLYGVYGQGGGTRHKRDAKIAAYRERWLEAILAAKNVQAVIALGDLADFAWQRWRAGPVGSRVQIAYEHITHPTQPQGAGGTDPAKVAALEAKLLLNWNVALARLHPLITNTDSPVPLRPYDTSFSAADLVAVPPEDVPLGTPEWMRTGLGWAERTGDTPAKKRAQILIHASTK